MHTGTGSNIPVIATHVHFETQCNFNKQTFYRMARKYQEVEYTRFILCASNGCHL